MSEHPLFSPNRVEDTHVMDEGEMKSLSRFLQAVSSGTIPAVSDDLLAKPGVMVLDAPRPLHVHIVSAMRALPVETFMKRVDWTGSARSLEPEPSALEATREFTPVIATSMPAALGAAISIVGLSVGDFFRLARWDGTPGSFGVSAQPDIEEIETVAVAKAGAGKEAIPPPPTIDSVFGDFVW